MIAFVAKIRSRFHTWLDRRRSEAALRQHQEALCLAVARQEHRELHRLIESGIDPNFVSGLSSPLALAAWHGDRDIVDYLLEHGASLDGPGSEYFLSGAVRMGDIDLIDLALESGISIHDVDPDGSRPLHHALRSQRLDVMEHLLSKGAEWSDLKRPPRWHTTPCSVIRFLHERGYPVPEEGLQLLRVETGLDPTKTVEPTGYAALGDDRIDDGQ